MGRIGDIWEHLREECFWTLSSQYAEASCEGHQLTRWVGWDFRQRGQHGQECSLQAEVSIDSLSWAWFKRPKEWIRSHCVVGWWQESVLPSRTDLQKPWCDLTKIEKPNEDECWTKRGPRLLLEKWNEGTVWLTGRIHHAAACFCKKV